MLLLWHLIKYPASGMQAITVFDYLLLPLYLAFFYWRVKRMSNKIEEADLKKYLLIAFGFRMLGAIGYSMLIQYYYGYGDSFTFYDGGNFYFDQILNKPSNASYLLSGYKESSDWFSAIATDDNAFFYSGSNNLMMRISAVLAFFFLRQISHHRFILWIFRIHGSMETIPSI